MNTNRNEPVVARFHLVDGVFRLLVSPHWKIGHDDVVLVKTRLLPTGILCAVFTNLGNTGARDKSAIDCKDCIITDHSQQEKGLAEYLDGTTRQD